ncbi:unnamed protein product [Ilex paraguariensis]|uniref:NAC domain-containing protein n=1 Tax=Ilex paraguariensis TaxID=185542 RepID=A0ABC8SQ68_9AQUA
MDTFSHVPPGFRFHPTDEELVDYYLRKKVASKRIDLDVIKDVDLYKIEPWDLQAELCKIGTEEQSDWYFFSHKDKKYPTGTRTNRATKAGFWKATGRDKAIYSRHSLVGMRKTLVFYKGRAPNGQKSDWIMHENHSRRRRRSLSYQIVASFLGVSSVFGAFLATLDIVGFIHNRQSSLEKQHCWGLKPTSGRLVLTTEKPNLVAIWQRGHSSLPDACCLKYWGLDSGISQVLQVSAWACDWWNCLPWIDVDGRHLVVDTEFFKHSSICRDCVFTAPTFSGIAAWATFLLTKEVKGTGAGLTAAALLAMVPSYISRSVAGSYDNEAVAIFALIFTFYLYIKVRFDKSCVRCPYCAIFSTKTKLC